MKKEFDIQSLTEDREQELLSIDSVQLPQLMEACSSYERELRSISVADSHPAMQQVYRLTDYLKLTTPDERLAKKKFRLQKSTANVKNLSSRLKKELEESSGYLRKAEGDYNDSVIFFKKCLSEYENLHLEEERFEEELNQFQDAEEAGELEARLEESKEQKKEIERKTAILATQIERSKAEIAVYRNNSIMLETITTRLDKQYFRNQIEIARISPAIGMRTKPIEAISMLGEAAVSADASETLATSLRESLLDVTKSISGYRISQAQEEKLFGKVHKELESERRASIARAKSIIEYDSRSKKTGGNRD